MAKRRVAACWGGSGAGGGGWVVRACGCVGGVPVELLALIMLASVVLLRRPLMTPFCGAGSCCETFQDGNRFGFLQTSKSGRWTVWKLPMRYAAHRHIGSGNGEVSQMFPRISIHARQTTRIEYCLQPEIWIFNFSAVYRTEFFSIFWDLVGYAR